MDKQLKEVVTLLTGNDSPVVELKDISVVTYSPVQYFKSSDYLKNVVCDTKDRDIEHLFIDPSILHSNIYNILVSKEAGVKLVNQIGDDRKSSLHIKEIIRENDYVLQKVFYGAYIKIGMRNFKRLAMLKSVVFIEEINMGTIEDDKLIPDIESGDNPLAINKTPHIIEGPDLIKHLCNFLYEHKLKEEFISDLNEGLSWYSDTIVWTDTTDVMVELITGDKIKMSFKQFLAIYSNVSKGVESL